MYDELLDLMGGDSTLSPLASQQARSVPAATLAVGTKENPSVILVIIPAV